MRLSRKPVARKHVQEQGSSKYGAAVVFASLVGAVGYFLVYLPNYSASSKEHRETVKTNPNQFPDQSQHLVPGSYWRNITEKRNKEA